MTSGATPTDSPLSSESDSTSRVQSVDRAARLLAGVTAASPRGDTLTNLAHTCGLNRATAWRLLSTLEANGLVDRDPGTNRYQLGFTLVRMAAAAGHGGLARQAHPILERICTEVGETAALALASRRGVVYIDEVAPQSALNVSWVSREVPVHATSTGKALLAWLPERDTRELLGDTLEWFTATTITDQAQLMAELTEVRRLGYATCSGESEATLYGVSAPVLDPLIGRAIAVFSIWGPDNRMPPSRFAELGAVAVAAAAEIADVIVARSPG